jgi:hypothetical protein
MLGSVEIVYNFLLSDQSSTCIYGDDDDYDDDDE